MSEAYTILPRYYDMMGVHPDYEAIAATVFSTYEKLGAKESGLFLDLACGTGRLTLALTEKGADVIGVDNSSEMLNVARDHCAKKGFSPLLLCQDMRELDLYGTVDVCVCATNSLNYLESVEDLEKVFALVHNFVTPGGLFFFDVNSLYKFETLYADNSYVFEKKNCFLSWQNDYDRRRKICEMQIDIFEKRKDGSYIRRSERQRQKYFSEKTIGNALEKAGFEPVFKGSDYAGSPCGEKDADVVYLARCVK